MMDEQQILAYIRQTAREEPSHLIPVSGGLTAAGKYRVTLKGRDWMVKLMPGEAKRDMWYGELNKRAGDQIANPKMHRLFEDGTMCLLAPWITGKSLEAHLAEATPQESRAFAKQAAKILLQLHQDPIELPGFAQKLSQRLLAICDQVEAYGLVFPGRDACCALLRREAETRHPHKISFVHKDVRPENFIVSDGLLYLIDLDNGSLGEWAEDFPYLTTMVRPEHMVFSKALIETYLLEAQDAQSFWQDNLLYSTVQVVEYAIWKWQTKQRQMMIQGNNLLKQYDGLTSLIPHWWETV